MRKVGDVMARPSEPGGAGEAQRGLDAAARAELDALRRRAFGPSPDIAGDAAALARLVELEDLALPAPTAVGERAAGSDGGGSGRRVGGRRRCEAPCDAAERTTACTRRGAA